MKLSEIFAIRERNKQLLNEIPHLHPGELPQLELDGNVSLSYIQREY